MVTCVIDLLEVSNLPGTKCVVYHHFKKFFEEYEFYSQQCKCEVLFSQHCLLFTVYCLLFTVYCLLFTVYCFNFVFPDMLACLEVLVQLWMPLSLWPFLLVSTTE